MGQFLPEFEMAAQSWARWRGRAPSQEEQREFGRRWRWTALWEVVWDEWVAQDLVRGSLSEYIGGVRRFWRPLRSKLVAPDAYDPAIEIVWREHLSRGPDALTAWDEWVRDTWDRMTDFSAEANRAVRTLAADHPTSGGQPPAPQQTPPEAVQNATAGESGIRGGLVTSTGDAMLDHILQLWRDDLRTQDVSKSHSNNLRRGVVKVVLEHHGDRRAALMPPDQAKTAEVRHALTVWQQWLAEHPSMYEQLLPMADVIESAQGK